MRYSKTFVFSQVVNSVDFVHRFDEGKLGIRAWIENEVRVTIEGEDEQECRVKMDSVDKIGKDSGGWTKDGADGEWRDVYR